MMRKKNVYLCDMASGSNMNLLPLAIGMVGSYAVAQPEIDEYFNIEYRFLRQSGKQLLASMDTPAVVGFSCYVWNLIGSLAAARDIKAAHPEAVIVLGGFSVPKSRDRIKDFLRKYSFVDVLIHGDGELTFAEFLKEYTRSKNCYNVVGLTYRTADVTDGFVSDPRPNQAKSLDDLPSPFLNGVFDEIMRRYGSNVTGALWETNRGCPYSCTFCDWGNADVNKVRQYNLARLYEEIEWISEKGFYYMFFCDANFGIFRERDLEIAGYIADLHERNGAPHHVVTNWAKNKGEQVVAIAERLARGGVASNITMAIQSTNPETLKVIKRKNLEQGKINQLKSLFHDRHIPTYVEVILGLPLETYGTFANGLNEILSNRLEDRLFVYLCQMLENAELSSRESRERYKLETRFCRHTVSNRVFQWTDEHTEYEEFVVGTSTMPVADWVRAYVLANFLTILYNHRAAVFVFMYLRTEFNVLPVDFLEFIIAEIRSGPQEFPALTRSIQHLDRQAQLMLDGVSSMSDLPEADGLVVLPHVGGVALLARDSDRFYEELARLTKRYCELQGVALDPVVLAEIIQYQQLRFPSWPMREQTTYSFATNIPEYFQRLTDGMQPMEVAKKPMTVMVKDHRRPGETFADFAATLVRGGLTVDLLEVEFEGHVTAEEWRRLYELRRRMEQRNLDKLKAEFDRVKRSERVDGARSLPEATVLRAPREDL